GAPGDGRYIWWTREDVNGNPTHRNRPGGHDIPLLLWPPGGRQVFGVLQPRCSLVRRPSSGRKEAGVAAPILIVFFDNFPAIDLAFIVIYDNNSFEETRLADEGVECGSSRQVRSAISSLDGP